VLSFLRQLTTWHCPHPAAARRCCGAAAADRQPASCAAMDRYLLLAGLTAANPPQPRDAGEWDKRTDRRRTPHSSVDPGLYLSNFIRGRSKFWLLKSTTVLMHRYIESRGGPLRFLIAAEGVRNFRGGFYPHPPPSNTALRRPYHAGMHCDVSAANYLRAVIYKSLFTEKTVAHKNTAAKA